VARDRVLEDRDDSKTCTTQIGFEVAARACCKPGSL
jgi:hypothetical protein